MMPALRPLLALVVIIWANTAWGFTGSLQSRFAPKPDLMPEWEANNPDSEDFVSHARWQALLDAYLIEDEEGPNLFRYGAVSDADRSVLDDYIASLEAVGISGYTRDEQKAYWINLYNALTVKVVLDHYPVSTIQDIDISEGFFARSGPWGAKLVTIESIDLSLDDIEHRILRPVWQDNRIHYAVNCAALGCPDLWPVAFDAFNTEEILEQAAVNFINSDRGVFIEGGRMTVSKIYEWYDEDFGGTEEGVIEHLLKYTRSRLTREINRRIGRIRTAYDWSLNEPQ